MRKERTGRNNPNYQHGFAKHVGEGLHPLYKMWQRMKRRCQNPNDISYKDYGARGISVCQEWERFGVFRDDMLSEYEKHVAKFGQGGNNVSLERKDVSKGYAKDNCQFATKKRQARNRRSNVILEFQGKKQCVADWADEIGIAGVTLRARIKRGWSVEQVLTRPKVGFGVLH